MFGKLTVFATQIFVSHGPVLEPHLVDCKSHFFRFAATQALQRTWCQWWKFQPLWKIRNYFGEKIGFYFAWAGEMASLLWLPMLLGIAIWAYGLYLRLAIPQYYILTFVRLFFRLVCVI